MRNLLLVVALAAFGACGVKRVPQTILENLPYEAKIELLESENDLALAVDRLDEARAEVARTREQIRRAKDRYSAAKSEVNAAADALSKDVAELAVVESDARVEWLRARQRVNVREESLADQNMTCALARHEQSRLTAARKAKLEGSEDYDPATFDQQVKDCDADYAALKEKLKETNTEADAVRAEREFSAFQPSAGSLRTASSSDRLAAQPFGAMGVSRSAAYGCASCSPRSRVAVVVSRRTMMRWKNVVFGMLMYRPSRVRSVVKKNERSMTCPSSASGGNEISSPMRNGRVTRMRMVHRMFESVLHSAMKPVAMSAAVPASTVNKSTSVK